MKSIDKVFNYLIMKSPYSNKIVWSTFSFVKWLLTGKKILRADYIEYTAKSYSQNVKACIKNGYLPIDYNHIKEGHWLKLLKSDKHLQEYFKL
jgi:hypothetical protein